MGLTELGNNLNKVSHFQPHQTSAVLVTNTVPNLSTQYWPLPSTGYSCQTGNIVTGVAPSLVGRRDCSPATVATKPLVRRKGRGLVSDAICRYEVKLLVYSKIETTI